MEILSCCFTPPPSDAEYKCQKSNPKLDCAYFFLLLYWKVEITLRMKEQLNAIVMVNMFAFTDQVRGVLWSGAVAAPDRDAS